MGLLDDAIREHLELKRKHGATDDEIQRAEQEALGPARRDPAGGPQDGASLPLDDLAAEPTAEDATAIRQAPPLEAVPPLGGEPEPPAVDDPVYADEHAAEPAPADRDEDPAFAETRLRKLPTPEELERDDAAPPPAALEREAEEAPDPGTAKPHGDPATGDRDEQPAVAPAEPTSDPQAEPHGDPATSDESEFDPDEVPAEERLAPGERDPYRARTSILDDPLDESAPPPAQPPADAEQDVLEETPDFLQETPEHDKLWFEQKPPRDFDFD